MVIDSFLSLIAYPAGAGSFLGCDCFGSSSCQLPCVSRVQVVHGLGRLPEYVSVTVRVPASGPNAGFQFEAVGMSVSSGNTSRGAYGGVVFGYNETGEFIWQTRCRSHDSRLGLMTHEPGTTAP